MDLKHMFTNILLMEKEAEHFTVFLNVLPKPKVITKLRDF